MLILPAHLESYRSLKDRTLKLTYETSELSPEQMGQVHESVLKTGFMAFHVDMFSSKQQQLLTELEVDYDDPGKTPSKRLRGVLYRNWEQDQDGYKTFEDYYRSKMEVIIVHFKGKLE